jgi:hypothetical protein
MVFSGWNPTYLCTTTFGVRTTPSTLSLHCIIHARVLNGVWWTIWFTGDTAVRSGTYRTFTYVPLNSMIDLRLRFPRWLMIDFTTNFCSVGRLSIYSCDRRRSRKVQLHPHPPRCRMLTFSQDRSWKVSSCGCAGEGACCFCQLEGWRGRKNGPGTLWWSGRARNSVYRWLRCTAALSIRPLCPTIRIVLRISLGWMIVVFALYVEYCCLY